MITLQRVRVDLGGRAVVRDVDLHVGDGEWLGIIGPNGAGKTTLLRALTGAASFAGEITIGESSVRGLRVRDIARLIAVVPQQPVLPPGITVTDYVLLGRTAHIPLFATETDRDLDVVADVLGRLELGDLVDRDVTTLSGGETQRAVVARALAQQAPILVLDEPTTALDIGHQQQVLDLIDRLRHERNLTVVSAMHDLTLAAQHADRFVLLDHGAVAAEGTAREVFVADRLERVFNATVSVIDAPDTGIVVLPRRASRT